MFTRRKHLFFCIVAHILENATPCIVKKGGAFLHSGIRKTVSLILLFLAAFFLLRFFLPLLLPFLLALLLALAAEPLVAFLCRHLRFPRALGAGVGVTLAFLILFFTLVIATAFLFRELGRLSGVLPQLLSASQEGLHLLQDQLLLLSARLPAEVSGFTDKMVASLFSGSSAVLQKSADFLLGLAQKLLAALPDSFLGFGTAMIASYMISAKLPALRRFALDRFPRERMQPWLHSLKGVKRSLLGYLRAQVKLSVITFLLLALGFLLLKIPYAPLWAFGTALVDAIPILGTGTVLLPWALVCLIRGDTWLAAGLAGLYVAAFALRSILEPRVVGKGLGLDPLLTLLSLYVGYKLWGILGMLLAPMLAVAALGLSEVKPKRKN